ncbi:MAG TPA: RluA family pseudouridine synthase [Tepidisphaeraceae bacterium]|jgi:23S rRNA pseudouridine1911/1915/1917 synthase|nr:RluA family pseudouridine synthase [Tepidisphaeraceae bacterium]
MTRTILDWLIENYPTAKRQTLKRMVQAGRVRINGSAAATLKREISETDQIVVDQRSAPQLAAKPRRLRIVYQDADLLVVDKPTGLLTSTVPNEPRQTLWAMAKDYFQSHEPEARIGLIHRLDRDASGLLIFSKNDLAYHSLKTQFFHHTVRREYTVIVHGSPSPASGRLETQLVERADGTVHSTRQIGKGQIAVTEYVVVSAGKKHSVLSVILQTGRKHQIRVHLSERGWPIVGDRVYGRDDGAKRLMLAATKLTIQNPRDGTEMIFAAPAPTEFKEFQASMP